MANPQMLERIEITNHKEESSKSLTCLPREILEEIASKVASRSLADLHHLKLTSKEMMNITDDDYVYKHASLEKVPYFHIPEIPQEASFLSRCRSSGNLESMYREGMETCFGDYNDYEKGLEMVRVTAQEGHKRSKYAFAMIVLMRWMDMRLGCLRTQELHEAFGNLRFLRNQKCVLRCRNEVAGFLRLLMLKWGCRFVVQVPMKRRLCENVPCQNTWRLKAGSWSFETEEDDENDSNMCENCRWDHELLAFCAKLLDIDALHLLYV